MELVAFVNPTGVILAALSHASEGQVHDMSALLGTLRLEELPADAVSEIRRQIARQGWALVSLDAA